MLCPENPAILATLQSGHKRHDAERCNQQADQHHHRRRNEQQTGLRPLHAVSTRARSGGNVIRGHVADRERVVWRYRCSADGCARSRRPAEHQPKRSYQCLRKRYPAPAVINRAGNGKPRALRADRQRHGQSFLARFGSLQRPPRMPAGNDRPPTASASRKFVSPMKSATNRRSVSHRYPPASRSAGWRRRSSPRPDPTWSAPHAGHA